MSLGFEAVIRVFFLRRPPLAFISLDFSNFSSRLACLLAGLPACLHPTAAHSSENVKASHSAGCAVSRSRFARHGTTRHGAALHRQAGQSCVNQPGVENQSATARAFPHSPCTTPTTTITPSSDASMSDAHRRSLDPRFSFPRAAQPEIVRAFQKDTYYRDLLTSHLNDVVRGLLGTRTLHAHMDIIALAGSTAYFALSSLGGSGQTLGEEYVNAMMVDTRTRRIVRARKRTAFIFLHVLAPFLLTRVYSAIRRTAAKRHTANQQAEQRARMRARALNKPPPPPPSRRSRLTAFLAEKLPSLDMINAQDGWLAYAGAAHLMLFYLGGRYYGVAQRLARVQYVRNSLSLPHPTPACLFLMLTPTPFLSSTADLHHRPAPRITTTIIPSSRSPSRHSTRRQAHHGRSVLPFHPRTNRQPRLHLSRLQTLQPFQPANIYKLCRHRT